MVGCTRCSKLLYIVKYLAIRDMNNYVHCSESVILNVAINTIEHADIIFKNLPNDFSLRLALCNQF